MRTNPVPLPEGERYADDDVYQRNLKRLATFDATSVERRCDAIFTISSVVLSCGYAIKGGFVRDKVILNEICRDLDVDSAVDATTKEGQDILHQKCDELCTSIEKQIPRVRVQVSKSYETTSMKSVKFTHSIHQHWEIELQFIAGLFFTVIFE